MKKTGMKTVGFVAIAALTVTAGIVGLGHAPAVRAADAAPAPALTQCIDTKSLESKMIVSKNQVVMVDDSGHAALVTLAPPCSQMDELDHVGFLYEGDTRLCQVHDIKILYSRENERPVQCLITDLKPLTKDEVKAYSSPAKH